MDHIGTLFTLPPKRKVVYKGDPGPRKRRGPRNERDELLEYFFKRLKPAWPKLSMRLLCIKTAHLKKKEDLYYLKSICEDAERRGGIFSKVFWGSLKPRPEEK